MPSPDATPVHHEHHSPTWQLGAIARAAGLTLEDNPYRGVTKRLAWERGWLYEDRVLEEENHPLASNR